MYDCVRYIYMFKRYFAAVKLTKSGHAYTGCVNTKEQEDLQAVCPTKKAIFSVIYIAFLEDNHHSTINYNKNKG